MVSREMVTGPEEMGPAVTAIERSRAAVAGPASAMVWIFTGPACQPRDSRLF